MGVLRLCILFLCFLLASVFAVEPLKSKYLLRNVNYGRGAPRHGLQLLFWFSQRVNYINRLDHTLIFDSDFNPIRGDFGFHRFENREYILPTINQRHYYSVGNLNYAGANALPAYVHQYRNRNLRESNIDRLMVSVNPDHPNRVYNVYITEHNIGMNDFNRDATHEIDFDLIAEIRGHLECTVDNNNNLIAHGENTEDEECHRFLTEMDYYRRTKRSVENNCDDTMRRFKLEITATNTGHSKLIWNNLPDNIFTRYKLVYIFICKNNNSAINNYEVVKDQVLILQTSGTIDTLVPLDAGLQPRLQLYTDKPKPLICYGPEFDDANRIIPTRIKGCDASLQLYSENGKASARLYIKKTFSNWKDVFHNSWVGFYTDAKKANDNYSRYKYAVEFDKVKVTNTGDYDIYKYQSDLPIAPGFQIRFLLDKNYNNVLARTTPWEGAEEVMISPSDCDCVKPKVSYWLKAELFYGPDFDNANRVAPTKIKAFDASLQLYTKGTKACARLLIGKTFKNWKTAFKNSWVGFYTGENKENKSWSKYQYAVYFEKVEGDTKDYDIYTYQSSVMIAPGVQIRFLLNKEFNSEQARTAPWRSV